MSEVTWKPVVGFEGLYEVSDIGDVRKAKTGRMLKPVVTRKGYRQVTLSRNGVQRTALIHALIAEAFLGPRPDDHGVYHRDGDKVNDRADNLHYATVRDRGDLTTEQVEEIRRAGPDVSCPSLASRFGVSVAVVAAARRGVTYKGVAVDEPGELWGGRVFLTAEQIEGIRRAGADVTSSSLAAGLGVSVSAVSRARRGTTYREVAVDAGEIK
jgi:DNA-binding transcriptional regulator YiaG